MNVCGVLVHSAPALLDQVLAEISGLNGAEIHHTADLGRIVVTLEDTDQGTALDSLSAIHRMTGVVSASLVYHSFEAEDARSTSNATV